MQSLKSFLRRSRLVNWSIRVFLFYKTHFYIKLHKFQSRGDLFSEYYRRNFWGVDESVSGRGSTIEYTEKAREGIEKLVDQLHLTSILDAPCGDYNWFQYVKRQESVSYIGGDIVAELVKKNQGKFGNKSTRFMQLDIVKDELPKADLWLCRDALFHFSNHDIFLTLDNFVKSNINYLLTTSHTEHKNNVDILTGNYRLLNLELAPFNLGKPILYIDDWIEGYPVRHLCLWDRSTLLNCLKQNPGYLKTVK